MKPKLPALLKKSKDKNTDVMIPVSPDPFVDLVERIAGNPDIDADKLEKIINAKLKVLDRNACNEFYAAFSRVQNILPEIKTDAWNDQTKSKYARLRVISKAITPIYTQEGFSMSFWEGDNPPEGGIRIEGILRHREGHSELYHCTLALDNVGIKGNVNKTKVHASGSTFTYGRRYLKSMIFDISVGDDNDGNADDKPLDIINAKQLKELKQLLHDTGREEQVFLDWAGVQKLEQTPLAKFEEIAPTLRQKAKRLNTQD